MTRAQRFGAAWRWIGLGILLLVTTARSTDFAHVSQRLAWLAHPVYGEASFDAFSRRPGNPVVRGEAPYDWPVNGFLFEDPVTGNWYAYTGHYGRNYTAEVPMKCTVSRSTDGGTTWEHLGPIFPDTPHTFEGEQSPEGHAPDVSVTYAEDRYHLVYDWLTESTLWGDIFNPDATHNSGVGYAWSERPEGPFHRNTRPVWTTRDQPALQGKYRRQYASTLIKRAKDWLVLTLTDSGPNFGWAYLARTAKSPEGPWSEAVLVLHPERDAYHPPLLEFHPSFLHEGWIYAPATSVALNRNVQALFRVPVERAMEPIAWELQQLGSVWHAEPVENEFDGLWGQAFSGFVSSDGVFNVLYPSRDSGGFGTINLASRPWNRPFNDQGFVVSGHRGPGLALLKRAGAPQHLEVALATRGTVRIIWGANMPLGPDAPRSDASLHPLMRAGYQALELGAEGWRLGHAAMAGDFTAYAAGPHAPSDSTTVSIAWTGTGEGALALDGVETWAGSLPAEPGTLGLYVEANSHARVSRFSVAGELGTATRRYLWSEGILGAAQRQENWEVVTGDASFTYGEGAISTGDSASAKWSVEGNHVVLHAPRGPSFGMAKIVVDGTQRGEIDYYAPEPEKSAPRFILEIGGTRHSIRLESIQGRIPLDLLEITGG